MLRVWMMALLFLSGCATFGIRSTVKGNFAARTGDLADQISHKVVRTLKSFGDSLAYPRSTMPDGGWKTVPIRDWTSGFFPGILWYSYELTNDRVFKNSAERWTEGLTPIQHYSGSHDVGFMVFCSFGNGYRLTHSDAYRKTILQTANTLISRFNPKVGCIRSWDHHRDVWQYPVIIDNMMNLELLFWASRNGGTREMYDVALQHAVKTMLNHFRADGSTYHVVSYDTTSGVVVFKGTRQGDADSSCWSRGQAWAVYGFAMSYRYTQDPRFLQTAQKAADYFIAHLPSDKVPYWDFEAPNIPFEPRDASAGAIAASALLQLSGLVKDRSKREEYHATAASILESLSSAPYFSAGSSSLGLLNHSVGSKPRNDEVDVSLIYGDYYFLEGLLRYRESKQAREK